MIHLQKLAFGIATVPALRKRVASRAGGRSGKHVVLTRLTPKRAEELLEGGSLYWVVARAIRARQRILAIEPFAGAKRCRITLEPVVVETEAVARKAFQGWRYLTLEDAPGDLRTLDPTVDLDPGLHRELADLGLL